jgi:hypothetical protein
MRRLQPGAAAFTNLSLQIGRDTRAGDEPVMTRLLRAAAFAAALALSGSPLLAKGEIEILAKFQQSSLELDVGTYTDPEFDAPGNKVGLIGFASGAVRNSFTLRAEDWGALTDLWAKAARMQSRNWRVVGSLSEKGTAEIARLTFTAGQGVRIAITSTKGASMSYLVAKADMARFEAAIRQVKDLLAK